MVRDKSVLVTNVVATQPVRWTADETHFPLLQLSPLHVASAQDGETIELRCKHHNESEGCNGELEVLALVTDKCRQAIHDEADVDWKQAMHDE